MSSKEEAVNLEKALRITLKTGKVIIGSKRSLKAIKKGQLRMIIKANNCPKRISSDIDKYCNEFEPKIDVYDFKGSSWDLGFLCGKPYMISVLGIVSAGDSEITKLIRG
ncbi:MAG: 50S ribosomal protein L30e [Candidatus Lokiarchaeota archaeon]|nr:50S ribosomal protein L30e [Candidatus Lokiarchaeota archaeon]